MTEVYRGRAPDASRIGRKRRLGHQLDGLSSLAQRMVESDGQPGEEAFATARLTIADGALDVPEQAMERA
jgi:hypothetical protein